jgi:hypothetical protein
MRQTLCRRINELEKASAALLARRPHISSGYKEKIARLCELAEAWHANPANQQWLAEQPPDYLHRRVQALRAQLTERAAGYSGSYGARGF